MTIEFIQKRIEGKEKELAKLEKKMERILKAQASNWENNPYYYSEYDLNRTTRELEKTKKGLAEYQEALVKETEKANSRNITVIIEFLDAWKERMSKYYVESLLKYIEAREEWHRVDSEYSDKWQYMWNEASKEEYKAFTDAHRRAEKNFYSSWNWLITYIEKDQINLEKLNKDLQKEADAKYDFIIERTNDIVGQITNANNLKIGAKGDLNGYIIGTNGTAKVQTVGAGGYNIQCYHFRTLINQMR